MVPPNTSILGDYGHDLVLLLNQLLTRCKDTKQKTKRQDRSLSRNVGLSTTSFDAEIPRSRTLGGIIEQYFDGSGNEVGTGSGCCQDGRAQRPASPPPKNPFSLFHATLSTHLTFSFFSLFSLFNISLFSPFSLIHATLLTHLIQSFKLISTSLYILVSFG